jgi:SAM-dependent methyltransferase
MDDITCAALAALNRAFYEQFAGDFAGTRRGWLPGFDRILPHLRPAANVLDAGCGNGRFLGFLAARGWRGAYTGVDRSETLLALAREAAATAPQIAARLVQADLNATGWGTQATAGAQPEAIVCLAVLHHIPGAANRRRFLRECAGLLPAGGLLVLSTWQFLEAPRLRAHILPWETAGIRPSQVELDDCLLSWGQGAAGMRYCAWIGQEALDGLADAAGLRRIAAYRADGREGNLNLYGVYYKEPFALMADGRSGGAAPTSR